MVSLLTLFIPLLCVLVIATYTDLKSGIIPNRLIVVGLVCALAVQILLQRPRLNDAFPSDALLQAVTLYGAGLLVCGLVPCVLFFSHAMGGGDVKLLALVGAFAGPSRGIEIEVYAFVLIALYAVAKLAYRGCLLVMIRNTLRLGGNLFRGKEKQHHVPPELTTSLRFAPSVLASTGLLASLQLILQ